jgi:hypothetical protein
VATIAKQRGLSDACMAGIAATSVYSFAVTLLILKALDVTLGLRVSEDEEVVGVDVAQHGERAYVLDTAGGGIAVPPNPAPVEYRGANLPAAVEERSNYGARQAAASESAS